MRGQDLPYVRRWWARHLAGQRDRQLPEALERMAASLRAGHSLSGALAEVAHAAEPPLAAELQEVAGAVAHGRRVEEAAASWAARPDASREVSLAATALSLGGRAGGEVARALDRVAATLRERRELRAEVRALATQARASAGILIVAPPAFALLASTVEPAVATFLFTSPAGFACLAAGTVLDAAGALWMARIVEDAG